MYLVLKNKSLGMEMVCKIFSKDIITIGAHISAQQILKAVEFDTPLGPMIAIANETALMLLEFTNKKNVIYEIKRLCSRLKAKIILDRTPLLITLIQEVTSYFSGNLKIFTIPLLPIGTDFQKCVWQALSSIPYGETRSYGAQAEVIGKSSACRAVANANGANHLTIIIPCHRVIASSGKLGGYAGGIERKYWLLEHEKRINEGL